MIDQGTDEMKQCACIRFVCRKKPASAPASTCRKMSAWDWEAVMCLHKTGGCEMFENIQQNVLHMATSSVTVRTTANGCRLPY